MDFQRCQPGRGPHHKGNDAMQSQSLSELLKASRLLLESCKRNLGLLERQIAACVASGEGMPQQHYWLESKIEPARAELCRESAAGTRALSEEAKDPEIKRLLLELADSYDLMAN